MIDQWRVFESLHDAIIVVSVDSTVAFANSAASDMFGWTSAELVGRSVEALVPERARSRHRADVERYAASPYRRKMQSRSGLVARRRAGEEFPVDIALSPLAAEGAQYFVATIRDLTARLEAEAELVRTDVERRALAQLVETRAALASELHDSVIQRLFAAGLVLDRVAVQHQSFGQEVDEVQGLIHDAIVQLRKTMADLNAPLDFNPEEELRRLVARLSTVLPATCELDVQRGELLANPAMAHQLCLTARELISNVARHAQATACSISLSVEDEEMVLRVADDGEGRAETLYLFAQDPTSGLGGVKRRLDRIGGRFAIEPVRPRGVEVVCKVSLKSGRLS
jgi:two-component system sensor histidine kinase DevS